MEKQVGENLEPRKSSKCNFGVPPVWHGITNNDKAVEDTADSSSIMAQNTTAQAIYRKAAEKTKSVERGNIFTARKDCQARNRFPCM